MNARSDPVADLPVIQLRADGPVPTELMVFGERNSGTNLAHELLKRNVPAFAESPGDRIGRFGFRYGWKHGFPQMLAAPDTALAVGLFRHPETWLRSMHARPWHAVPTLRDLSFDAFIRAEWQSRVDERNFGIADGDRRALAELQWDRHPLTGRRFANLMKLRAAKSEGFLSLPERFANCLLISFEPLAADPEGFVALVAQSFGLECRPSFEPVNERRGKQSDGAFQPEERAPLSPEDHRFVWSQLDRDQEARLGYSA